MDGVDPEGIVTAVGLLLSIGGAITLAVSQNSEAVLAADRAEILEPLTSPAR